MVDEPLSMKEITDEELGEKLLAMAKAIKDSDANIKGYAQSIAGWTAVQVSMARKILEQVEDAKDPETSKPIFSNKEKREAEVERRCKESVEYANLTGQITDAAAKKREAELGLDYMERVFSVMNTEFKRRSKDSNVVILREVH